MAFWRSAWDLRLRGDVFALIDVVERRPLGDLGPLREVNRGEQSLHAGSDFNHFGCVEVAVVLEIVADQCSGRASDHHRGCLLRLTFWLSPATHH